MLLSHLPIETLDPKVYLAIEENEGSQRAFFRLAHDMGFDPQIGSKEDAADPNTLAVLSRQIRIGYVAANGVPQLPREYGKIIYRTPVPQQGQKLDLTEGYHNCLHQILNPARFFENRKWPTPQSRIGAERPILIVVKSRHARGIFSINDGTSPA